MGDSCRRDQVAGAVEVVLRNFAWVLVLAIGPGGILAFFAASLVNYERAAAGSGMAKHNHY